MTPNEARLWLVVLCGPSWNRRSPLVWSFLDVILFRIEEWQYQAASLEYLEGLAAKREQQ